MWKRKELKTKAKASYRRNRAAAIAVCFIIAFLTASYAGTTTILTLFDASNKDSSAEVDVTPVTSEQALEQLRENFIKDNPNAGPIHIKIVTLVDRFVATYIVNTETAISIINMINNFMAGRLGVMTVIAILGIIIKILYDIFFATVIQVGEKRFFLENRNYINTKISKIFYIFRIGRTKHTAWIMIKKEIFYYLWCLTIIGGIIKNYEYMMIPFIVAENPDISAKDAFRISKEMMRGNKWRAFVLDFSFVLWDILGTLTLGIANIIFVNPYITATRTELYMALRESYVSTQKQGYELLNDFYLDAEGDTYPADQFSIPVLERAKKPLNPGRHYSIVHLILLFFIFSFVGWIWEVSIHIVEDGLFVNRGTMFGPWLPIYGSGAVLVIILVRKWVKKPLVEFFLICFVCAVVEYSASWWLETTKGVKWWDYSGYFMNLNGRICLEGIVIFGIGGCAAIYFVAPMLDDALYKIPNAIKYIICFVLLSLYGCDMVYSHYHPNMGKGITDYAVLIKIKANAFIANIRNIRIGGLR